MGHICYQNFVTSTEVVVVFSDGINLRDFLGQIGFGNTTLIGVIALGVGPVYAGGRRLGDVRASAGAAVAFLHVFQGAPKHVRDFVVHGLRGVIFFLPHE
jgi:hypothetical protein